MMFSGSCLCSQRKGDNKHEEDALRQLTEWLSKMKFEDGKSVGEDNPKLDPLAGEYLLQFWDSFSLRNIEVRKRPYLFVSIGVM